MIAATQENGLQMPFIPDTDKVQHLKISLNKPSDLGLITSKYCKTFLREPHILQISSAKCSASPPQDLNTSTAFQSNHKDKFI